MNALKAAAQESPVGDATDAALLSIGGLIVEFPTALGWRRAVDGLTLDLRQRETLGLVGESGCGKTVSMLSILGLARNARVTGTAIFEGTDLLGLAPKDLRAVRGNRIGMIFQQPTRSLNPAFKVGEQIAETIRHHRGYGRKQAWARAVELLDHLAIPNAAKRAHDYPHTFSGGMCQRAAIAIALSCDPVVLIADEPTTALDVTVQARILEKLREIQREMGIAMVLISHDLGVVSEMCDRSIVMYSGRLVESGKTKELLGHPQHPYTEGLLQGLPENVAGGRFRSIPGNVPSLLDVLPGCSFAPRCGYGVAGVCDTRVPEVEVSEGHEVRCVRRAELSLKGVTRS